MTEKEAKTRWCPFVRLTASGAGEWHTARDPSLPSAPDDTQAYRCIASACMAWRWERETYDQRHTSVRGERASITRGYCGLAGTPQ